MCRLVALALALLLVAAPASLGLAGFSAPPVVGVPTGPYTTYSPAVSANSGTFTALGTVTGRWQQTGKRVDISLSIAITTNGTAAGNVVVSLPVAAASAATFAGREINATGKALTGSITAGGSTVTIQNYDNTYPGGTGYAILVSGSYEAQ